MSDALHLLLVEDLRINADMFRALLPDHRITIAANGHDGITSYQSEKPDIVFLDLGLPDMSGFDVLEKIRALDASAYVIVLSGMNSEPYVRRAQELGAEGFLGKPYQKDSLNYYINRYRSKFRA